MAKDSDWETIVPADDSGWETIIPANQGRGSINPPADAPLPNFKPTVSPVAPARVLTRAAVTEADTSNIVSDDFGGAAIMAQNPDAFTEVNRGSVMTGRVVEKPAPLIEQRGAPVSEDRFNQLKKAYDAATPDEREALIKSPGVNGTVFKTIADQYKKLDTSIEKTPTAKVFDTRREARRDRLIDQGMEAKSADALATKEAGQGAVPEPLAQAKPSTFDFETKAKFARPENKLVQEETGGLITARTIKPSGLDELTAAGKAAYGKVVNQFGSSTAGAWQLIGDLTSTVGEVTGTEGVTDFGRRLAGGNAILQKEAKQKLEAIGTNPNAAMAFVEEGVSGAITNIAPYFVVGPTLAVSAMVSRVVTDEYGTGRAAGLQPGAALARATAMGVAEYIGERASLPTPLIKGFKDLIKGLPADQIMPAFAKYLAKENVAEQVTTALNFGTDKWASFGITPNATLADYLQAVGDTFYQTTAQTLVMGGAGRVAAPIVRRLTEPTSPEGILSKALNEGVAGTEFNPEAIDALVRRSLDVQSYDANIISPTQTARVNRAKSNLDQATTVDDMTGAANELAGNLNEMLVPENMVTPLPPVLNEPTLTGDLPPLAPGRVEPTLTNEPLALTPGPDVNVETEQQFGLDKLRMNAPRPQSIQGKPASSLTDDELSATIADSNVSAITRRSAEVELKARQSEQAPNAPAATTTATTAIPDITGTLGSTPVRGGAAAPVSELPGADTARANAQRSIDRWAATQGVASPIQFNPAPAEETSAVSQIGQALNSQFGTRLFAYHDTNVVAPNGVAINGTAFVNTGSVAINVGRTSLHEFKHTIEQIAKAETDAGLTNTPAQQFTTQIEGIFDDMTDAGKRAYIENFLHKDDLAGITDPAAREARIQQYMTAPLTRSEMTADFLGNRATDKRFWADVAKADPQGFKGFVDKWLKIIDGLLDRLRGTSKQGKYESARVDKYVRDLNRAKMVARDALVAYRKGTLQQFEGATNGPANNVAAGNQNIPGIAASARPELGQAGRAEVPSYGTGRQGAISVVGRHYSSSPQQSLSGAYYGRGLKGAERNRLDSSTDPRLKSRIYFYVDQGSGIRQESGVGGYAHEVKLDNIYDSQTGTIRPQADLNGFESAVINAGFDGYLAPFGNNQAAVVLLGQKHKAVPVAQIGQPAAAPLPQATAPTTLKKGLLSREANAIDVSKIPGAKMRMGSLEIPAEQTDAANAELERIGSDARFAKKQKVVPARVMFEVAPDPNNADLKARWEAVPFERKIEISQRVAEKIMPQVFRLAGVRAKMTTQLGGYLEDTSPSFAALLPSTASAEQLMDVARLGGFGLAQDSMMVLDSKPFKGSSPTGLITITLPENRQDQESVHAIYRDLRQVSPENISGHTTVEREMVLAVPSDSMDDLASKIESVLGNRPENFILKTGNGQMAFPSKEEYDYGQEGTGSPEFLAKRAEARRIREEASAAIEAELAKDESTGGRKIDTGVYRSVADGFGLSQAEYNASALPLMLGGVKDKIFRAPKIGGIPETIQWLDQRYRDAGMPNLDINKAEDRATLAKLMSAEAVAAIRSAGNAVEWYDETIDKMLSIMSVKYPELNTDPDARNAFLIAVAISSQKMDVESNLTFASSQYEAYRASVNAQGVGKFPEIGQGTAIPAMVKNFALANKVMADMGPTLLRRFLQTEFTKRELETAGFRISSESMDEKMLGSAIFGPKIGFGFYSNLTGNFEPITMDMWFMRFVGRLSGTLLAFDPVLFPKQVAKLREALAETGDLSRGVYASAFDPADVAAAQQTDEGAIALARKIHSLHNRQFTKERAAFDSNARIKTALVNASNGIIKSADKPTDAPGSGGERQRLRDVTRQMVAMVEQQTGKRVPPAALQALVWYPEQELYKKLGVDLPVTSQDYAGAAQLLLTKEGFDEKQISAAAQPGPGPARQVAGKQNAGTTGQTGQPTGRTGPLQGAERETFIQTRTSLEDIFDGLNKRGLAKTRAEAAYTARPDGAQIKYVQENFLDILSELEDSDLVKINCD